MDVVGGSVVEVLVGGGIAVSVLVVTGIIGMIVDMVVAAAVVVIGRKVSEICSISTK